MEACAVKLAKAACPNNVYEQGSYISGFLQATDMIYGWDYEAVGDLVELETVEPYSLGPDEVYDFDPGDEVHIKCEAC